MAKNKSKGKNIALRLHRNDVNKDAMSDLANIKLPLDRNFVIAACDRGDLNRAVELCARHARALYDKAYGDQVEQYQREIERLLIIFTRIEAETRANDRELASQPLRIPAACENGGVDGPAEVQRSVWFWNWSLKDKLAALFSGSALAGILAASFLGAEATFADSGLPIFEHQPLLTYALAALPPAASIAFKFIGSALFGEANKAKLRKYTAIGGAVAFALWIPIFSGLFEGVAGVFDPFAEPNHLLGWGFNTVHIISEVLIGAGLYAHLDSVFDKYSPSRDIPNPKREPLLEHREKLDPAFARISDELGAAEGGLRQLNGILNDALTTLEAAIEKQMNVDRGNDLI